MHCEDFPGIAIRIRKPELILTSKATGSVLLDPLQDALYLKTFLQAAISSTDSTSIPKWSTELSRPVDDTREVQGRLRQIEFCVILRLLLRCHAKYLLIKRHRCRDIAHQRHVVSWRSPLWLVKAPCLHLLT